MRNTRWATLAFALLAGGCTDADRAGKMGNTVAGEVDTVGGVVSITHPNETLVRAEPIHVTRDLVIGAATGDSEYEFAQIWDIESDEDGNIYVLDALRREVLKYNSNGVFERAFGREGSGPGEFRWPARLVWVNDALGVWDPTQMRLTYFSQTGEYLTDTLVTSWHGVQEIAWARGMFFIQVGPAWGWPPGPGSDGTGLLLRANEAVTETLLTWADSATVAYRARGISAVAAVPFGVRPAWDVSWDGRLYFTPGDKYLVIEYSSNGKPIRAISREYERFKLSAAEKDSLELKVDSYRKELRERVRIPRLKPATGDLKLTRTSMIWVRTFTADDSGSQRWESFDCAARLVGVVSLPLHLQVKHITDRHFYAVSRDTLGVARLERFAYEAPRGCS